MDNKLTKKRLSAFLSYEWILLIIAVVVSIILWELVYTVSAVRLTTGQNFKFYYDQNLNATGISDLYNYIGSSDTFSYDIKEFDSESLNPDYNVLSVRLSVQEGDVIFTDKYFEEGQEVRAKNIVDNYGYSLSDLLSDGQNYLKQFLSDGETDFYDFNKLDKVKIEQNFNNRSSLRVYKNALKKGEISINDEYSRIEKLCKDIKDFDYLLNNSSDDLFFRYTRYEQMASSSADYQPLYEKELQERNNVIYGLNVGKLSGGKKDISEYVKVLATDSADDVVLCVLNMKEYQEDLEYETVSFIVSLIKNCSNILG